MKSNYDFCIKEVLKSEGGYTNDPNDAGGPTNFGITLKDYRLYINPKGTAVDVQSMTVDQAKAIYKSKYWDAVNGDQLFSGIDYTTFDYAVNSGVSRAVKVLKSFEPCTVPELINKINDERLHFLHNIRNGSDWVHFGKGWNDRVARVRKDSLALSTSKTPSVASTAVVATAAGGASLWQWGLPHWMEITASVAFLGLLTYLVIHSIRKYNQ